MEDDKKRGKRRFKTQLYIKKQLKIWNSSRWGSSIEPHLFHKKSAMDCGHSQCKLCGNRRHLYGEKTIQEQKVELDDIQDLIYE